MLDPMTKIDLMQRHSQQLSMIFTFFAGYIITRCGRERRCRCARCKKLDPGHH